MLHININDTAIWCLEESSETIELVNKQSNVSYSLPVANTDEEEQYRCFIYIVENNTDYTGDPAVVEGITKCNLPVGTYTYVAGDEKGLLQVGEPKETPTTYNKNDNNIIYYEPR